MAIRSILHYPDPRLHTIAQPVKHIDDGIQTLVTDMFETMYATQGIGLAATQIDVHKRVVVIDIHEEGEEKSPLVLINPEILELRGTTDYEEGCLSVPGFRETVTRSEWVKIKAQNQQGEWFELETDGLLAICIQHELDHLLGKVFVQYMSNLKQNMLKKKIKKHKMGEAIDD